MADPDFEYRPWSLEQRRHASAAARKRIAREARVWNTAIEAAEKLVREVMSANPPLAGRIAKRIRTLRKEPKA